MENQNQKQERNKDSGSDDDVSLESQEEKMDSEPESEFGTPTDVLSSFELTISSLCRDISSRNLPEAQLILAVLTVVVKNYIKIRNCYFLEKRNFRQ
jgi:hypothetical protein